MKDKFFWFVFGATVLSITEQTIPPDYVRFMMLPLVLVAMCMKIMHD